MIGTEAWVKKKVSQGRRTLELPVPQNHSLALTRLPLAASFLDLTHFKIH